MTASMVDRLILEAAAAERITVDLVAAAAAVGDGVEVGDSGKQIMILLSKGWIDCDGNGTSVTLTAAGRKALR
jgi:hypothetical protein